MKNLLIAAGILLPFIKSTNGGKNTELRRRILDMIIADDGDGSLIEQALVLQEGLGITLVTPQEIVNLKRDQNGDTNAYGDKNWAVGASNWYLLERFGGIGFEDVTELKLLSHRRTSIPESIGNLKNLKSLSVGQSQLTSLPESIGNLKNLKYLSVNNNQLTSLPNSIGNLKSLKKLSTANNKLTSLPESIGNLKNLEGLFLQFNQLTSLPNSIGNLRSLIGLDVMGNQLTSLPDSIKNLKNLEELYVKRNPLDQSARQLIHQLQAKGILINAYY